MQLSAPDQERLSKFLYDAIQRYRGSERSDFNGVASGNLFGILDIENRDLTRKLVDRQGLVAAARNLGFVIEPGNGGSRAGSVVWEFIDLPLA
ncbi:hypothetical protein FJ976_24085 [Mesorhizobium sp. B1-1-9]|uniref:hypothetical protein n=1 Tax=Mesorhizobium sp. B1-1-9 TaxID=2589975 RepID=UPI00112C1919|nr:hypothetical protein [Mesorhizobium sp. B1-1-9]TPN45317.1 hypothetical protein FJ976_24085 [Mesorhizobium sp. B1-1-9]